MYALRRRFRRRQTEYELAAELHFDLEQQVEEHRLRGLYARASRNRL